MTCVRDVQKMRLATFRIHVCVAYEWVMLHKNESCYIWANHVAAYEQIMSLWTSHVQWMRPVAHGWVMLHMNESCRIRMSHVTHEWVKSHVTVYCHIWISHGPVAYCKKNHVTHKSWNRGHLPPLFFVVCFRVLHCVEVCQKGRFLGDRQKPCCTHLFSMVDFRPCVPSFVWFVPSASNWTDKLMCTRIHPRS